MNYLTSRFPLPLLSYTHEPLPLIGSLHHRQTHRPSFPSLSSLRASFTVRSLVGASIPANEGEVPVIALKEYEEKDWSFLERDDASFQEDSDRIISVGEIGPRSRVLVSIGSEAFVDRLVHFSPCSLLVVVHESLEVLATIKEKYDDVKCWQGGLINVPEKWAPFNVVFLYFLPALPFHLPQILESLSKCCSTGAKVVISHDQGRLVLEQQRKQCPDVIVSDLPDGKTLRTLAADYSFEVIEFIDEPNFYLAVLKHQQSGAPEGT